MTLQGPRGRNITRNPFHGEAEALGAIVGLYARLLQILLNQELHGQTLRESQPRSYAGHFKYRING